MNANMIYRIAIWICVIANFASGNVQSKVRCFKDRMEVDVTRSSPQATIYLENLKNYPDEACKPKLSDGVATFKLSLIPEEMLRCGLTRVLNKMTGKKVYYHRIIVEEPTDSSKHTFTVKCGITEVTVPLKSVKSGLNLTPNRTILHRRSLPDDFEESEVIGTIEDVLGTAPTPTLSVGVRQGGNLVTGELHVSPGTPLQMEIYLDTISAPTYGILTTYMQVSDMRTQEETIIFNGCSVDPYLFDNFDTVDGDFLTAKFRAFKFPESTYVQFRGTVNVCVDKCEGIECSNGRLGYGRKRRSVSPPNGDKNNLFEVTMSTFIKVDFEEGTEVEKALLAFVLKGNNVTASQETAERPGSAESAAAVHPKNEIREQYEYKVVEMETAATVNAAFSITASGYLKSASILFVLFCILI
ncbi:uncharacterized protein LOC124408946 [Diprion similis]|uniref:uncharacterized protein LOC124408946 n=1 Tax=Diprion similis TaxID=362088 RepID=UPI001EF86EDF|nr:uncharacterized protein LOC124408946 [Diprion similis]